MCFGNLFFAFWTLKSAFNLHLIFLLNEYFFLQANFLSVKNNFRPLKRNLKQALRACVGILHWKIKGLKVNLLFFFL